MVHAETNRNQAIKGDIHIPVAMTTMNAAAQLSKSGTDPQISNPASPPFIETQILVTIRLTMCVAMIAAIVMAGIRTRAVSSFETTVSASVTGNERQNRMLLSLRSAYRESRGYPRDMT